MYCSYTTFSLQKRSSQTAAYTAGMSSFLMVTTARVFSVKAVHVHTVSTGVDRSTALTEPQKGVRAPLYLQSSTAKKQGQWKMWLSS